MSHCWEKVKALVCFNAAKYNSINDCHQLHQDEKKFIKYVYLTFNLYPAMRLWCAISFSNLPTTL